MEQEYRYNIKIPKSRIAVLIGVNGEVKKSIEQNCKIKLDIDSKEGEVFITGKDSLTLYTAQNIIKAIARGFNPETAMLLLKPDFALEILKIVDFAKGKLKRARGRVIGEEGKARMNIEAATDCRISVDGKTVAIIGRVDNIMICSGAVKKLLQGSTHSSTYRWIDRMKRQK